jgi:hypothetical protein
VFYYNKAGARKQIVYPKYPQVFPLADIPCSMYNPQG